MKILLARAKREQGLYTLPPVCMYAAARDVKRALLIRVYSGAIRYRSDIALRLVNKGRERVH